MIKLKRASLALVGAGACALTIALAVPASADPGYYGDCPQGSTQNCSTPKLHLCPSDSTQRDPLCVYVGPGRLSNGSTDGYNDLHAVVRLDPILCAHAVVDANGRPNRDLIRTASCARHDEQVIPPVTGAPCTCPAPAPVVVPPSAPVTGTPAESVPAPAPTIINNNTATSPLPAVTH